MSTIARVIHLVVRSPLRWLFSVVTAYLAWTQINSAAPGTSLAGAFALVLFTFLMTSLLTGRIHKRSLTLGVFFYVCGLSAMLGIYLNYLQYDSFSPHSGSPWMTALGSAGFNLFRVSLGLQLGVLGMWAMGTLPEISLASVFVRGIRALVQTPTRLRARGRAPGVEPAVADTLPPAVPHGLTPEDWQRIVTELRRPYARDLIIAFCIGFVSSLLATLVTSWLLKR